jgi:PAS domain S-box-containing protein
MPSRFRNLDDQESLRRYVQSLREGIYITKPDGEILDGNPAFLKMMGVASITDLKGKKAADLLVDPLARDREKVILERDGAVREFELQIRRPDGEILTVIDTCFTVADPATGDNFYHGTLVDITDRKRLELQLLSRASDPLTGCFNRRYLEISRRGGRSGAVGLHHRGPRLLRYNDQYGHEAGDPILNKFARFLMHSAGRRSGRGWGRRVPAAPPKTDEKGTENIATGCSSWRRRKCSLLLAGYASRRTRSPGDDPARRPEDDLGQGHREAPSGIHQRLA